MNLPASDRDLGFRSVLASPDEAIVLALVDALEDQDLRPAIDAVGHLHEAGGRFKLVIYVGAEEGASVATIDAPFVSVLEPWARGMLPAILAASDVVVASGSGSRALLGELRDSCRDCARSPPTPGRC